jgi:diketogulonate reductase-like aldo/keto reductase
LKGAMPALGMGTWHMGEDPARRAAEVRALQLGLDLGMDLIDTSEMYGEGGAEEVVGEALRGRRDGVCVVSKFYPHHASKRDLPRACEASLARLGVERIDLYLLHWRGNVPLAETVEALERLVEQGRIARWGVSNFDVRDMEELLRAGGGRVACNQVLYHLAARGIEFDLLPWCAKRPIDVMAYCPLDQGKLTRHRVVVSEARRLGIEPGQLAIAWLIGRGVVVIPKASREAHVRANAACGDIRLDDAAIAALDGAFPPPREPQALGVI